MKKILVVDDSTTMRKIIKNVLTSKDPQKGLGLEYEIIEAADGEEALAKFKENEDDIYFILTDWNMPKMDGLTFVKEVRKINKKVPIVMITTEASKPQVIQALKAGVNQYIVKPFTPGKIKEKLEQLKLI